MKCGECPVATTNPKDKMDCYFCPFDKVDAFHSLHDCSHLSELVERMAELLKEQQAEIEQLRNDANDDDDYDPCYECRGLGDDYIINDDGELESWCDKCGVNPDRMKDEE